MDGTCSYPALAAGEMCTGGVCDGMAMCVACLTHSDCTEAMCVECTDETHFEDENDCTADLCTEGACSNPPLEAGTACLGGVCNDRAVCVECLTVADCANGWLCSEENTCYQPSMPDAATVSAEEPCRKARR